MTTLPPAMPAFDPAKREALKKLAGPGEEVPSYAAWASELGEVTPEDIAWAKSVSQRWQGAPMNPHEDQATVIMTVVLAAAVIFLAIGVVLALFAR